MGTTGSLHSPAERPDNNGAGADLRRTVIFPVRLTADEKRQLDALAGDRGLRLAAYIRVTLLGGPAPPPRPDPVLVPPINRDAFRHLAQVGNNLNQIARRLNREDGDDPASTEILATIRELIRLVRTIGSQLLGKGRG